ncbi:MAG: hypothetical protein O7G85_12430 [Planctomycetota bacterium]|nr:hypothetical protein [Planctomycetota bacterium]
MDGHIKKILICGGMGLLLTLVFAFGSAFLIQRDWLDSRQSDQMGRFMNSWSTKKRQVHDTWNLRIETRFGAKRVIATNGAYLDAPPSNVPAGFFPSWSMIQALPEVSTERDLYGTIENAYGYPLPCLWHSWAEIGEDGNPLVSTTGSWGVGDWRWPHRPIWGALVINTILFGSLTFLAMRLPKLVRRYARRCRGNCPGCGDPIRSLDGRLCDSCGHAVTWLGA